MRQGPSCIEIDRYIWCTYSVHKQLYIPHMSSYICNLDYTAMGAYTDWFLSKAKEINNIRGRNILEEECIFYTQTRENPFSLSLQNPNFYYTAMVFTRSTQSYSPGISNGANRHSWPNDKQQINKKYMNQELT